MAITADHITLASKPPWRFALIGVCAIAPAAVLAFAPASPLPAADPELATLLRGMATLKALMALAAAGAIWLRLAHPISGPLALGYVSAAAALFGGAAMVWTLTLLGLTTIIFHGALLALAWLALRDGMRKHAN